MDAVSNGATRTHKYYAPFGFAHEFTGHVSHQHPVIIVSPSHTVALVTWQDASHAAEQLSQGV